MRERVLKGVKMWVNGLIDGIAPDNIMFALLSNTIKRAAGNLIEANFNFDVIKPFITDIGGSLDVDTTITEITSALEAMPQKQMNFPGGWGVKVGEGSVIVSLPDNEAVRLLTDHLKTIKLTAKDFADLVRIIKEQE